MAEHWSVTVVMDCEEIITLGDCMSGREIGPQEEEVIRCAAHHLLAFIGDPHPPEKEARHG